LSGFNKISEEGRAKLSANSHLKKGLGERMCNDRGALSVLISEVPKFSTVGIIAE
jgi:hypothetical protein